MGQKPQSHLFFFCCTAGVGEFRSPSPSLDFGFSTPERDPSLAGKTIQVKKLTVTVKTTNRSVVVCCDVWTFLAPAPLEFPGGALRPSVKFIRFELIADGRDHPWSV